MRPHVYRNVFWESAAGVFPWKRAGSLICVRFGQSCSLSAVGMKVTVKACNRQAADQSVCRWLLHGEYCKRHAKDTLHDRRFQLAGLVLCLQWDTRNRASRVSTSTSRLSIVGIRSDTREELIDSAGADEPAVSLHFGPS